MSWVKDLYEKNKSGKNGGEGNKPSLKGVCMNDKEKINADIQDNQADEELNATKDAVEANVGDDQLVKDDTDSCWTQEESENAGATLEHEPIKEIEVIPEEKEEKPFFGRLLEEVVNIKFVFWPLLVLIFVLLFMVMPNRTMISKNTMKIDSVKSEALKAAEEQQATFMEKSREAREDFLNTFKESAEAMKKYKQELPITIKDKVSEKVDEVILNRIDPEIKSVKDSNGNLSTSVKSLSERVGIVEDEVYQVNYNKDEINGLINTVSKLDNRVSKSESALKSVKKAAEANAKELVKAYEERRSLKFMNKTLMFRMQNLGLKLRFSRNHLIKNILHLMQFKNVKYLIYLGNKYTRNDIGKLKGERVAKGDLIVLCEGLNGEVYLDLDKRTPSSDTKPVYDISLN